MSCSDRLWQLNDSSVLVNQCLVDEQTQLELFLVAADICDVVPWLKTIYQPDSSVDDTLQRYDGRLWQTGEQSIAVVQSCQHERCHNLGSNVTTEQMQNLMQTSQLEEAGLCHLSHIGLHAQLAVEVDAKVAN